ncbi:hypothetical protein ID852_15730, partial [Xenorhabdus sp. 42]|uniref:hypothetical protein n=1 Tax=Xenorhabdus szentirmaii TaxID=290112 RepID=UPI0019CE798C
IEDHRFISPPEGDPDRRWIIDIIKYCIGWVERGQIFIWHWAIKKHAFIFLVLGNMVVIEKNREIIDDLPANLYDNRFTKFSKN